MARFFIDRPVFAWVLAILICLMGGISITQLPVAQYPSVAPPSISITANYAGASAETLSDTVTSVIEQQLNGIDNLLYMSSASDANGTAIITLYFKPGTDPDVAQVQVQNKVQLATPEPAADRAAARGRGRQGNAELRDVHRSNNRRWQPGCHRAGELHGCQHARSDPARAGSRRGDSVRHPVCDADLAGSRETDELRPDPWRHLSGRRGTEHPGPGRPARPASRGGGPAAQHHPSRPRDPARGFPV